MTDYPIINNPDDRAKLKQALDEISNSLTRIEAERSLIKDIKIDIFDNFSIPKRTISKLARMYHKQNLADERQQFEEVETLFDIILNRKDAPAE
jgi:hypothetical protein